MLTTFRRSLFGIICMLLIWQLADAQTAINPTDWTGHGASVTGPSAFSTLPASTTPGSSRVNVSQWDRAGSIAYNTAGSSYNSNNWTTGGSLSAAQSASSYVYFTVTTDATTELEITGVTISTQVSNTGPGVMQLCYAIGSGSDVTYGSAYSGYARTSTLTYSSSGTIHLCPSQTIKFKLYGWSAGGSAGTLRINNNTSITARYVDDVVATATATSGCSASTVSLTGSASDGKSGYTYAWSGPSGFSSTASSPSSGSLSSTGVYTLVVTDSWGCQDTATATVSSSSSSFPLTFSPSAPSFCAGSGGVSVTVSGAGSGGRYTWSPSTGLSSTTGSTVTANPGATTLYSVTATDLGGCTSSDTIRVTVLPAPSAISGSSSVCVGATTTFTNTVSGGTWSSASSAIASVSTTGVVTGVSVGTTNITYTIGTCYVVKSITVNPLPNAGTISGSATVCAGATTTLTTTGSGGSWSNRSTSISSVSTGGVVIGISAGIDTIYYIATTVCGTAIARHAITVLAQPVGGTLTGRTKLCSGDTTLITASSSGGVFSSTAPGVATVSTTGLVTAVSGGSATISYAVTNSCGTAYATLAITVYRSPVVTVTPAAPSYCFGGNTSLLAGGAVSYIWSAATALSATTGASVVANPSATTIYTVVGTDANACTGTATVTVTVYPLPTVTAPNITICKGFSGTLTASGATNYVWSPSTTLSSAFGTTVTAFPTDTTTYLLTGTDINGCTDTALVRVNVNPIPLAPGVVTPDTLCLTETATALTATGRNLLWYTTPTPGTGGSATAPIPATTATGTFTWYVSQTVEGCESPLSTIVVQVLPNAIADFDFNIGYGCNFDTVWFTNKSQFADGYVWRFGDNASVTSYLTDPQHRYAAIKRGTAVYNVQLTAFNKYCYDDSETKAVVLMPSPQSFSIQVANNDITIATGGSAQLEAQGALIYRWTPNDGTLSDPNINNPVASPVDSTTYVVYGYDVNGCYDTATVIVRVVHDELITPVSAFTPNGDGKNDVFRLVNIKTNKLMEFSVYNRWGEQVFYTNNIENGWDGTWNGVPQDMGVYTYVVMASDASGKMKVSKGTVTLIR